MEKMFFPHKLRIYPGRAGHQLSELKIIISGDCADFTVKTSVKAVTKIVIIGCHSYCTRNDDDLTPLIKAGKLIFAKQGRNYRRCSRCNAPGPQHEEARHCYVFL